MKVALYVPAWPPASSSNGIVTYVSNMVPELVKAGNQVFLVAGECQSHGESILKLRDYYHSSDFLSRIKFKLAPTKAHFDMISDGLRRAVMYLHQGKGVDVFEIEETGGWSLPLRRERSVPVVIRLHGPWFLNGKYNDNDEHSVENVGREKREGEAIAAADFVTAPSLSVLEEVKKKYGLELPHSRVIPNPITVPSSVWDLRGVRPHSLLFVGRFDRRKGGDLILRVFSNLAKSYPSLTLTFAGPDKGVRMAEGSTLSFEQFKNRHVPPQYHSRILFCGAVDETEVRRLRLSHFVTVVASQYEIAPYAVLEAMAMGCPVVGTSVGGIPELLASGRNSLLVPSQDIQRMTEACRILLESPERAVRLGQQARSDCESKYSPRRVAADTILAYKEAVRNFEIRNENI